MTSPMLLEDTQIEDTVGQVLGGMECHQPTTAGSDHGLAAPCKSTSPAPPAKGIKIQE